MAKTDTLTDSLKAFKQVAQQLASPLPEDLLDAVGDDYLDSQLEKSNHLPEFVIFHPFDNASLDVPELQQSPEKEESTVDRMQTELLALERIKADKKAKDRALFEKQKSKEISQANLQAKNKEAFAENKTSASNVFSLLQPKAGKLIASSKKNGLSNSNNQKKAARKTSAALAQQLSNSTEKNPAAISASAAKISAEAAKKTAKVLPSVFNKIDELLAALSDEGESSSPSKSQPQIEGNKPLNSVAQGLKRANAGPENTASPLISTSEPASRLDHLVSSIWSMTTEIPVSSVANNQNSQHRVAEVQSQIDSTSSANNLLGAGPRISEFSRRLMPQQGSLSSGDNAMSSQNVSAKNTVVDTKSIADELNELIKKQAYLQGVDLT